jgi:hypothetical protein
MSRWSDLAVWAGPTPNQTKGHIECRGLVVHIASGFYDGTLSWQKNPDANVSSHFTTARDGRCSQTVDTDDTAWTQRAGNGHWLSVENEGFALDDGLHATHPGWEKLTDQQVDKIARLFLRGHEQYGYPLQLATSPTGKGLGYHSMGAENGYNWGHLYCPGEPIKAQLPTILARAQALAGQSPTSTGGTTVSTAATEDIMNRLINNRRVADILGAEDAGNKVIAAVQAVLAEVDAEVDANTATLTTIDTKLEAILTVLKTLSTSGDGTVVTAGGPLTITLTGTATPEATG